MNKPLWQPSIKKREESLLMEFSKFVELKPSSFNDIWRWSIENPKIFWSKFWDFSKMIGDKGEEIIRFDKIFNKTKFFPDAKIKF